MNLFKPKGKIGKLEKCKIDEGKVEIECTVFGKLKIEIDKQKDLYLIETPQMSIICEKGKYSISAETVVKTDVMPESIIGKEKLK